MIISLLIARKGTACEKEINLLQIYLQKNIEKE